MFSSLARSFASMTPSPFHWALSDVRRMARHHRHLESGGPVPAGGGIDEERRDHFVLPPDVGAAEVATAIEDWLRQRFSSKRRGNDTLPSLQTNVDGKVVVPSELMLMLG